MVDKHNIQRIQDHAFAALSRREYAPAELARKLAAKGFDPQEVAQVLNRLQAEGYLNENRFIDSFVQTHVNKGHGPLRIRQGLREHGVTQAVALEDDPEYWQEQARQVRLKRFGPDIPQERKEQARQMRFLQYRGFSVETIRKILSED